MIALRALLIFPLFCVLRLLCRNKEAFEKDVRNWCRWKNIEYTMWNSCLIFVGDKAFRNLLYHRCGPTRLLLAWAMPGYDHLQITTPNTELGGGLIIQHGFSTIISACKIGRDCKIYQQVTIGYNHRLEAPAIGDNVEICCGAKVIGGVRIGNNVLIGANAVVVSDVPDNSIVAGVPARIIGHLREGETIFDR